MRYTDFGSIRRGVAGALIMAAVAASLLPATATAELQNVIVGGELRIRGQAWSHNFGNKTDTVLTGNNLRYGPNAVTGRPIGDPFGVQAILSFFDWDNRGDDYQLTEQRTRLNIRADFTEDVSAFVEFEAYHAWGENFRSNYVTGIDTRGTGDVVVHQGYIEARNMFDTPIRLRIGRQELLLGSGWLIGTGDHLPEFPGLSFDGVRATWLDDQFSVDAIWAKIADRSFTMGDNQDTDFFALYGSYTGLEDVTLDAYWMLVRDSRDFEDTMSPGFQELFEDWFGLDDYGTTMMHTVGVRAAGGVGGFDYSAEMAYQFGEADAVGVLFRPYGYGDNRADFDAWAAEVEVGYTFDVNWQPRVHILGAYFDGEDNRDITFWEWLNPFSAMVRPQSSVSFNRLFSDRTYTMILDDQGALSNFWTVQAGVSVQPTETLRLGADVAWFETVAPFDQPWHLRVNGGRVTLPGLAFLTYKTDSELGWETGLWFEYRYTDDLLFKGGWRHFFVADGSYDGNFVDLNGLVLNGGTDDQDSDYFYLEAALDF